MVLAPMGHAAARPVLVAVRVLGAAVEVVDRGMQPVLQGAAEAEMVVVVTMEEDVVAAVEAVVGVAVGVELSWQWEMASGVYFLDSCCGG
jgi:hypothetical protein